MRRGEDGAQGRAGQGRAGQDSPFLGSPPSPQVNFQPALELEPPVLGVHPLSLAVLFFAVSAAIKITWTEVKRCVSGTC